MEANGPNVVEHAHPTVSRASFEGWPLRWKVAAIMVLPVLLAATFGALRIQNELSAASKLSVASGDAGIVVPAVEFVDRLDGLAYAAASGAPIEEPLTQFDASATALASLTTSAEFDPTVAAALATASSTAKTLRDEIASGPVPQLRIAEQAESVAIGVASAIATTMATVDDGAVRAARGPARERPCGATGADNAAGAGRRAGFRRFGRAADQGGGSGRCRSGGDRSARPADADG